MNETASPRDAAATAKRQALEALGRADPAVEGAQDAPSCAGYYVSATLEYQAATSEFEADHRMAGYAHLVVADAWYHAGEICDSTGSFP